MPPKIQDSDSENDRIDPSDKPFNSISEQYIRDAITLLDAVRANDDGNDLVVNTKLLAEKTGETHHAVEAKFVRMRNLYTGIRLRGSQAYSDSHGLFRSESHVEFISKGRKRAKSRVVKPKRRSLKDAKKEDEDEEGSDSGKGRKTKLTLFKTKSTDYTNSFVHQMNDSDSDKDGDSSTAVGQAVEAGTVKVA